MIRTDAALRASLLAAQGPATGPRWAALLAASGGECVSAGTDIAHPAREAYAYPDDFDRAVAYAAEHEGRTIHGRGMPPGAWGLDGWAPSPPCYYGPGPIDRDGIRLTVDVGDGHGARDVWRWQAFMPRPAPPPSTPALVWFAVVDRGAHDGHVTSRNAADIWSGSNESGWTYQDVTGAHGAVLYEGRSETDARAALVTFLDCPAERAGRYCYTHNPRPGQ